MTNEVLDPLIHAPVRLRIMVTLSALRDGDALSFPRLQQMLDLTPGNLITHLRKLEGGGYVVTEKDDAGTSVALTAPGRQALEAYTIALRGILDGV
jgi:DNA-binding MarR family transcriptional regulator